MFVYLHCRLAYGGFQEALRHEFFKMRFVLYLIALQNKLRGIYNEELRNEYLDALRCLCYCATEKVA